MALWLLAYLLLGRVLVPLLASLGLPLHPPPSAGPGGGGVALAHLALDAAQLAATCAILRGCLGEPWAALRARGLFCFRWRRAREWAPAVAAGCLAFPAVGWAARAAAGAFGAGPLEDAATAAGAGAAAAVAGAAAAGGGLVAEAGAAAAAAPGGGAVAAAAAVGYALVVAVCAPLWEEAVFRGFLLPSLAAYGPWSSGSGGGGAGGAAAAAAAAAAAGARASGKRGTGAAGADPDKDAPPLPVDRGAASADALRAVVLSAAAFAGCHFRADTALPMFLLGLVFGGACVATRGALAAPVALHGLWNVWAVANSAMMMAG